MKIDILASGSAGNCIALTAGNSTILIDAGVAKTKIEKRLLEVGINPANVEAIFITHAHGDHIKGLPLANKYSIPVYAGEEEWSDIKGVDDDLKCFIGSESVLFNSEGFEPWMDIEAFDVHHDALAPKGYVVQTNDSKVSICLDTGKVDADMLHAMRNSDTYIIEANHDVSMVEASQYPNSVKARVLSDIGHLSNVQVAEALSKLIQGHGEQIYLMHLSSKNNMPALAKLTVIRALSRKGYKADQHYKLEVI